MQELLEEKPCTGSSFLPLLFVQPNHEGPAGFDAECEDPLVQRGQGAEGGGGGDKTAPVSEVTWPTFTSLFCTLLQMRSSMDPRTCR